MNRDSNGNIAVGAPGSFQRDLHEFVGNPATPFWAREFVLRLNDKDVVDVLNVLSVLEKLFEKKMEGC